MTAPHCSDDARADPDRDARADADRDARADADRDARADADRDARADPDPDRDAEAEAEPDRDPEADPDPESDRNPARDQLASRTAPPAARRSRHAGYAQFASCDATDPVGRVERPSRAWPYRAIATLAACQRGVITRAQLTDLGVGRGALQRALATGLLHPIHRGVYGLMPLSALPALAAEQAAVLACGPRALLSHRSAAALWGLPTPRGAVTEVDITIVGAATGRRRASIRFHRAPALDPRDRRRHERLAVTAPARTLLDLVALLSDRELERAVDEALARHLTSATAIREMLNRHAGRAGTAALGALVAADRPLTATRSEAEERLMALIRRAGLPAPEVNARVGRLEVDFLWRSRRVVVEVDGFAFHASRRAFERDHARDASLRADGFEVIRFSWRQITNAAPLTAAQIAIALGRAEAAG